MTQKLALPASKSSSQVCTGAAAAARGGSVTGIDWSAQLKKIERQFDGLPAEPSESELRAKRENERRQQTKLKKREDLFGAGSRVVLALSLSLAIAAWPYDRACGVGLRGYLGAATAIIAAGLWATVGTWRGRAPKLHALALLTVAWGAVLIAAQILPRVGYAKLDADARLAWRCWGAGQT
ncbi:MAG TPA: hypothetical protein VHL59_09030, partial [Thermoanaerobaculia bacterium]|nr:hypothetical protein [Thermoanaerobaculia bacterium]